MKKITLLLWLGLGFCMLGSEAVFGQPDGQDITIGQRFRLKSEILGEDRPYLVYLPRDYSESGQPVAVMYLMDGDGHFHHTSGVVDFLIRQGRIPRMMIVAIPNTDDRTRDLTPTILVDDEAAKRFPTAGGANKTLDFIKTELIPKIEEDYHVNSYRLLVGHSFGGIFAVNALLTDPSIFDSYISISPSMWWDQQNLVERADKFLESNPELDQFFYMTMGDEGGAMLGGAMKLAALFEEKSPDKFAWDFKVMKEETHGSIPHRSTYYGLEAIFKKWFRVDLAELYLQNGLTGVNRHYENLSAKLGYKMEPSEANINNLGYQLMAQGDLAKAIELFQENVKRHPKSFNAYDSLAEGFMNKGENEEAIEYYKQSLVLHPGNQNAVNMLKKMGVEYDPSELLIQLPAKKLKDFSGKYQLNGGPVIQISLEDGMLVGTGGPTKQTLHPFGDEQFLAKPDNMAISFERDDEGKVKGMTVRGGPFQKNYAKKLADN